MKKGLVMEGGSMRGMFTAGVTDVFLENGVEFDGAVGVSAGAVFGCNFKSKQIGRVIRYNKKYCTDPRYVSFKSLIKTGSLYGVQFAYHELPQKLDIFDNETYVSNEMEFYVVGTDVKTGEAVYHKCETAVGEDLEWMRASASLPLVSKYVNVGGYTLSDGGTADPIPIKFIESKGYDRNVVILTQPKGFIKTPSKLMPLLKVIIKEKNLVRALETRHIRYNEATAYLEEKEKRGEVIVIRPPEPLNIGAVEHKAEELERVYQIGRNEALKRLSEVQEFLKKVE